MNARPVPGKRIMGFCVLDRVRSPVREGFFGQGEFLSVDRSILWSASLRCYYGYVAQGLSFAERVVAQCSLRKIGAS